MKLARMTLGEAWRNERLDGRRFYFPNEKSAAGKWAPPPAHPKPPTADGEVVTGGGAGGPILELDVVYADPLDPDTEPCDADEFRSLMRALELSTTEGGRLALLRQANQAYYWSISQVLTLLFMYSLDSSREEAMVGGHAPHLKPSTPHPEAMPGRKASQIGKTREPCTMTPLDFRHPTPVICRSFFSRISSVGTTCSFVPPPLLIGQGCSCKRGSVA